MTKKKQKRLQQLALKTLRARRAKRKRLALKMGVKAVRASYFIVNDTPKDGVNGTAAGKAFPGAMCSDSKNGIIYVNCGSAIAPVWTPINSVASADSGE